MSWKCLIQQLMMNQRQFLKRKILFQFDNACLPDVDSLEMDQTLDDLSCSENSPIHSNSEICSCKCTCRSHSSQSNDDDCIDPVEKKRIKRRQYKKRLKNRQKEMKQNALKQLEEIIKQIYALKSTFLKSKDAIERCISIETNKDRFYDFINFVIREQVDAIRQEIRNCLNQLVNNQIHLNIIPRLYEQFTRVKDASPEVEKIINLFIRKSFKNKGQFIPFQKNLDKMTFRFIFKNDIHNKTSFGQACEIIFHDEHKNQREKQMLKKMIEMYGEQDGMEDESDQYSDEEDDYDRQDELLQESQPKLSCDEQMEFKQFEKSESIQQESTQNKENEKLGKVRAKRKKRANEDFDTSYQTILNRLQKMTIKQDQRVQCNVPEDWKDRMRHKLKQLTQN